MTGLWREAAYLCLLSLLIIGAVALDRARQGLLAEAAVRVLVTDEPTADSLAKELRSRQGTRARVVSPEQAAERISRWIGLDLDTSTASLPWVVRATPAKGEPFAAFVERVGGLAGSARVVVPEAYEQMRQGAVAAGTLALLLAAWAAFSLWVFRSPPAGRAFPGAMVAGLSGALALSGLAAKPLVLLLDADPLRALAAPWGAAILLAGAAAALRAGALPLGRRVA
ncbi:hypothetical protein IIA16_06820 [bacterium]|nr:hypothetical protein [bacterium]